MNWHVVRSDGRKVAGPYRTAELADVVREFLGRHGRPHTPYGELRVVSDDDVFDDLVASLSEENTDDG